MSFDVAALVPALRSLQDSTLTERCRIVRRGSVVVANLPCRKHKERLFSEPADPQDANMRSTQEWSYTFPSGTDIRVADTVETMSGSHSMIVGEVLVGDTWEIATRAWGTIPKSSTPTVTVELWRYQSGIDDWSPVGVYDVQIVYDRNQPEATPLRYSPAARSEYKGGWLIGNKSFAPRIGDRFTLDGHAGQITQVLPFQPQRVEARFALDLGGAR